MNPIKLYGSSFSVSVYQEGLVVDCMVPTAEVLGSKIMWRTKDIMILSADDIACGDLSQLYVLYNFTYTLWSTLKKFALYSAIPS